MAPTLEQCEQNAKKLPLQDRALLIKHLIAGLDDLDEENLEQLWLQEATRRFKEFEAGHIKARPAKEVFQNARARLREI